MAEKKKQVMPKIKAMTVKLTVQEVLALRYIHSHWANTDGESPFCDAMSDSFLEKLGGYFSSPGSPLWDHPIAKEWYNDREECDECKHMHLRSEMKQYKDLPNFDAETDEPDYYLCAECFGFNLRRSH